MIGILILGICLCRERYRCVKHTYSGTCNGKKCRWDDGKGNKILHRVIYCRTGIMQFAEETSHLVRSAPGQVAAERLACRRDAETTTHCVKSGCLVRTPSFSPIVKFDQKTPPLLDKAPDRRCTMHPLDGVVPFSARHSSNRRTRSRHLLRSTSG